MTLTKQGNDWITMFHSFGFADYSWYSQTRLPYSRRCWNSSGRCNPDSPLLEQWPVLRQWCQQVIQLLLLQQQQWYPRRMGDHLWPPQTLAQGTLWLLWNLVYGTVLHGLLPVDQYIGARSTLATNGFGHLWILWSTQFQRYLSECYHCVDRFCRSWFDWRRIFGVAFFLCLDLADWYSFAWGRAQEIWHSYAKLPLFWWCHGRLLLHVVLQLLFDNSIGATNTQWTKVSLQF